jgi:hypothetical protein
MFFRPTADGMSGNDASSSPRLNRLRTTKEKFSGATSVNIGLDSGYVIAHPRRVISREGLGGTPLGIAHW